MIKYHKLLNNKKVAEVMPGNSVSSAEEILDLIVETGYQDCIALILHSDSLHEDFFDLKTGLAGEILQKFSNYRMKLSIIGDFSAYESKSLQDFIRESNRARTISFVKSLDEAFSRLVM